MPKNPTAFGPAKYTAKLKALEKKRRDVEANAIKPLIKTIHKAKKRLEQLVAQLGKELAEITGKNAEANRSNRGVTGFTD